MSTLPELRARYPDLIPLHLHDGEVMVWHPKDVEKLRRQHSICGLLTGTLPLIPQQNVFLGLPMQLCNEEVVWLLRRGAAMLVVDAPSHRIPTPEQIRDYWASYHDQVTEQRRETKRQRDETRRQFEAKLNRATAADPTAHRTDNHDNDDDDEAELEKIPYHHITAGSSEDLPWFTPSLIEPAVTVHTSLSSARTAGHFTFPQTEMDVATCCVFEDLHAQGFFLGVGIRFGGQFTVYPGDPLRYHAHYSASIFASAHSSTSALELVASGRLGTAVKKSHLICSVDSPLCQEEARGEAIEEAIRRGTYDGSGTRWGEVAYYSLSWAGFGT